MDGLFGDLRLDEYVISSDDNEGPNVTAIYLQGANSFLQFNVGHLIEIGVLIVAFATYRSDRRHSYDQQVQMHAQNSQRLDEVVEFTKEQCRENDKMDAQIGELRQQTATLTQIAKDTNRRLEMLENRRS